MTTTQFYCRQPKSIDLIQGGPGYATIAEFEKPDQECRIAIYSKNGALFAFTQPSKVVIVNPNTGETHCTIEINDTFDLHFSPNGSFLCLWCKPVKDAESGNYNDNVFIYNVVSKEIIAQFSNKSQSGWKPQFTSDEKLYTKNFQNKEIHFYDTNSAPVPAKPLYKYKVEEGTTFNAFEISPGRNPAIAIFSPEKSGKPASVKVYNIPNFNQPVCSKKFFKAERCQLKWNSLGTALLALASIDVDTSNKSYDGETNLYLLGIAGSYDSRITLDKEGPIHDVTWSPSAREFGVVYGFMPAQTTFFDARGNSIFSMPPAPRNTILFSPHAKFVLVAGFGNLQGTVDVFDRQQKFSKICTIEASNTSVCSWSPDGRYILTATTSPRLRVDNGLKIWHASGKLIFAREYKELFSINWRPQELSSFPPLKNLEAAPEAHESVKDIKQTNNAQAASKPAGAYRPPHARNGTGSAQRTSLYQKEMENNMGAASAGAYQPPRTRVVPGATPPPPPAESKSAAKNRKKREAKKEIKDEKPEKSASPQAQAPTSAPAPVPVPAPAASTVSQASSASSSAEPSNGGSVIGGIISFEEKKIRSLLKKLRAIENLKMKQAGGETLEDTQLLKIQTEDKIRGELGSLGWNE